MTNKATITTSVIDGVTVEIHDNGHTRTITRTGALPCGCEPHSVRQSPMGFHCITESQGYCNFECECDDD